MEKQQRSTAEGKPPSTNQTPGTNVSSNTNGSLAKEQLKTIKYRLTKVLPTNKQGSNTISVKPLPMINGIVQALEESGKNIWLSKNDGSGNIKGTKELPKGDKLMEYVTHKIKGNTVCLFFTVTTNENLECIKQIIQVMTFLKTNNLHLKQNHYGDEIPVSVGILTNIHTKFCNLPQLEKDLNDLLNDNDQSMDYKDNGNDTSPRVELYRRDIKYKEGLSVEAIEIRTISQHVLQVKQSLEEQYDQEDAWYGNLVPFSLKHQEEGQLYASALRAHNVHQHSTGYAIVGKLHHDALNQQYMLSHESISLRAHIIGQKASDGSKLFTQIETRHATEMQPPKCFLFFYNENKEEALKWIDNELPNAAQQIDEADLFLQSDENLHPTRVFPPPTPYGYKTDKTIGTNDRTKKFKDDTRYNKPPRNSGVPTNIHVHVNYDDDGTNESDRREPPTKKNARKNAWKTDSATVVTAATYGTNHSEFDALQKQIAALKAALEQQREATKKEHEQLKTKVDSNEKLHAREHQAIRNELDHLETTVSNKVEGIEHTIDELQERTDMIEKQTEKLQIEQTSTKTDTQECLTLLRMLTANMTNTNTTSTEPTTTDMMSGTEQSMTESSNVDTQEMSENPPNGNDTNPATTASMDTETEQDDSNQQWNTIPLRIRPKALLSRSRNKTTKATKPTNTAYTTTTTTNPSLYARAAGTGIQTPNRINAKDPHETPLAQVDNSKRTRSERTPTYDTPMRDPRRRLNLNTPRAAPLNSKEEEDEPNWQDENWDEQDSNDEVNRSKNYYSHLETFDEDDENNGTDDERNDDSGAGAEKPSPKSS